MADVDPRDRQLQGLTRILELGREARAAGDAARLAFVMVNDSVRLTPYRQAVWLRGPDARIRVEAVSGLPDVDQQAPFVDWFTREMRRRLPELGDAWFTLDAPTGADGETWRRWLPTHLAGVRLTDREGRALGVLVFARDEPFGDVDRILLGEVADVYGHAASSLPGMRRRTSGTGRGLARVLGLAAIAGTVAALALVEVHQSALGEAEVVADSPHPVRAPLDGVIDEVRVTPNQAVREGDLLMTFDATALDNEARLAERALAVAEAEFRQAAQAALFDPRSKAQLPVLKGRVDQRTAELAYVEELRGRVEVRAPRSGIVVFGDATEWVGRAVSLGEGIMLVADPERVELEVQLPVADAVQLEPGARMRLFLNTDPLAPVDAELVHAAYRAAATADGVMAFRLKGRFVDTESAPRIGLRGTAKVYGEPVALGFFLLRRPLATVRRWVGL